MTDQEILDQIEAIRAKNNVAHVSIQRLALWAAPAETRKLLTEIIANDREISALSQQLVDNAPSLSIVPGVIQWEKVPEGEVRHVHVRSGQ